jgi:hypothetical protein
VAFGNGTLFVVAGGFAELEGQLSTAWGRADELDSLVTIFTCIALSVTSSETHWIHPLHIPQAITSPVIG